MPFKKPSLFEINNRILSDISVRFHKTKALPDRSPYRILSAVLAAESFGLYQYLEWISKQAFIDTCDPENIDRIAGQKGIYRNKASTAKGKVTLLGNADTLIPSGTSIVRSRDGMNYTTTEDCKISPSGSVTVSCVCKTDGKIGDSIVGDTFSLTNQIAGVDSPVTVVPPGFTGGVDIESDPSLISRYFERIRQEPSGGNLEDYKYWMKKIPGVNRVWIYSNINEPLIRVNEVNIFFITDDVSTLVPSEKLIDDVQTQIRKVAPTTAILKFPLLTTEVVNLTIKIEPFEDELKMAADQRLRLLFATEANLGETLPISKIYSVVSDDKRIKRAELEISNITGVTVNPKRFSLPVFEKATWKRF